jgi:hypothetical protein
MPDTLRLAGALLAPHSHQESDLLDGDLYARLAASETVAGLWGFPAAGIRIGQEALSSPVDGVLAVDGDLAVGGSISLDGTVDGVDVSDHAALHERGGSQEVRAARLHSGADADKPASGNTEGDVWWAADTDKLYVWNGAAWKEIGAAGGGGSVAVEEADVQVVAAASVLDFGAGFDVTEGPSGEANIALDLTEAVWTFAQGGFRFRDGSGPLLYAGASGDDLFLTGDLDVSGHVAIGSGAAIQAAETVRVFDALATSGATQSRGLYLNVTNSGAGSGWFVGGYVWAEHTGASGRGTTGLFGQARSSAAAAGSIVEGLNFAATASAGAYGLVYMAGIKVSLQTQVQSGTIADAYGLWIVGSYGASLAITTLRGIYLPNSLCPAGVANAYGLHIEDMVGSSFVRLLEMGPSTPYLRLVGGAAPGANQTNLYLNENGTLRRVQWKAGNTLGAGDKVLVLV